MAELTKDEIKTLNIISAMCKHLGVERPRPFVGTFWEVIIPRKEYTFIFRPLEVGHLLKFYHAMKRTIK
ncbi:MAG: hypothetical protein KGI08_09445 [Thaumarchaeota archaeon]|nr:hypothetical protein [Nitrososphaerota archaeon]